jgi:excisionase family DNA binding protein
MPELEELLRSIVRDEVRHVIREELADFENRNADRRSKAEALLNVKDAARHLGIRPSTLYKKAESIEIASVKIGSRITFRVPDLDAYVNSRRRSPELVAALARRARTW